VHRILVGRHKARRPLERPRLRWEDNIKIDVGQKCAQGSGRGASGGKLITGETRRRG
jgi:hypothetical protein